MRRTSLRCLLSPAAHGARSPSRGGVAACMVLAALLAAPPAAAQIEFQWSGNSSSSINWSDPFNWYFLTPPVCTQGVAIVTFSSPAGSYDTYADVNCNPYQLRILGTAGYTFYGSELWINQALYAESFANQVVHNSLHFPNAGGVGGNPREIENSLDARLTLTGSIETPGALEVFTVGPVTLSGQVYGSGYIAKSGDGTLLLSGNNSYSGGTLILQGTLATGASNVIPPGTVELQGGPSISRVTRRRSGRAP